MKQVDRRLGWRRDGCGTGDRDLDFHSPVARFLDIVLGGDAGMGLAGRCGRDRGDLRIAQAVLLQRVLQHGTHLVGAALTQPLVVAFRAGGIRVPGDREPAGIGVMVFDQPLRGGKKIVEDILFVL